MPGLILLVIGIAIFSLTLSYTDADGTVGREYRDSSSTCARILRD